MLSKSPKIDFSQIKGANDNSIQFLTIESYFIKKHLDNLRQSGYDLNLLLVFFKEENIYPKGIKGIELGQIYLNDGRFISYNRSIFGILGECEFHIYDPFCLGSNHLFYGKGPRACESPQKFLKPNVNIPHPEDIVSHVSGSIERGLSQ